MNIRKYLIRTSIITYRLLFDLRSTIQIQLCSTVKDFLLSIAPRPLTGGFLTTLLAYFGLHTKGYRRRVFGTGQWVIIAVHFASWFAPILWQTRCLKKIYIIIYCQRSDKLGITSSDIPLASTHFRLLCS